MKMPPVQSLEPALSVRNVRKSFRGIRVLEDVSFDVHAGSVTALVGSNGAGKSTLVNVITGLLEADGGEVRLAGRDITRLAAHARARAGLLRTFQHPRVFDSFSAAESVALASTPALRERLFPSVVDLFRRRHAHAAFSPAHAVLQPLAARAALPASQLSYGEKKLLMLAQVLAAAGRVLCFDELCAGLEPAVTDGVRDCLLQQAAGGKAVIFVEHNLALVRSLATRVIFLHQGRVHRDGAVEDVLTDPDVVALYLGA